MVTISLGFYHVEPVKADIPELDNMGFVDNISSLLSNLLSTNSKEVKCVESIVFSSFNPPPSYRRYYHYYFQVICVI